MRCEGWVRHGGMMTFGPVEWKQCENDGIVMIKFIDNQPNAHGEERSLPACLSCWKRCIKERLNIIEVTPIDE